MEMAETKSGMKKRTKDKRRTEIPQKIEVGNDIMKNGREEESASVQAAGQGGKGVLSGKERMQIFPLHLKMPCKLSVHLSKNWLQVEQEQKKRRKCCP